MSFQVFRSILYFIWILQRGLIIGVALAWVLAMLFMRLLSGAPHPGELGVALPFAAIFGVVFPIAVFSFSASRTVASGASAYPVRLFTLPVRTRDLVFAPMLGGAASICVLWPLAAVTLMRPIGVTWPLWWPAGLFVSTLAWVQIIAWSSLPSGWLRFPLMLAAVGAHAAAFFAVGVGWVSERTMLVAMTGEFPIVFMLAVWTVARARRGLAQQALQTGFASFRRRLRSFSSTLEASTWLQGRQRATTVRILEVAWVFIVFPLQVTTRPMLSDADVLTIWLDNGTLALFSAYLFAMVSAPAWAGFGADAPGPRIGAKPMPAYVAVLPIRTGDLVWAKYRAALRGTLVMLAAGLGVCAMLLYAQDRLGDIRTLIESPVTQTSAYEGGMLIAAIVLLYAAFVYGNVINCLWVVLHGRRDMIVLPILMAFVLATGIVMGRRWLLEYAETAPSVAAFAGTVARVFLVLAAIKAYLFVRLTRTAVLRRHYTPRQFLTLGVSWSLAIAFGAGLFIHYVPPGYVAWYAAVAAAFVLTPMLGILAAPAMLSINRHQ